ncbi:MAG: carbohydrate ABC transporter substrate-binding protein [Thalassovita sp.]
MTVSRVLKLGAAATLGLTVSTAALADTIVLDVIAWKGNEAQPAGFPELIAKFEAENPGIEIDLTFVARKDVDKLIPPRLQGGNPPDLTMVDSSLNDLWGEAGFLSDLGQSSDWYANMNPTLANILSSGDEIRMMPLEVIGMGNFVNMGILRAHGIENPPLTLEDTLAVCAALQGTDINPMVFAGGFPAMLWVGANGLDPKGTSPLDYGTGEVSFVEDPAFNASLDSVRQLVDAGCFDPDLQAGLDPWSTALEEFKSGRSAMLPQGAWNISQFSRVEGLDFEFAPMPSINATVGMALDLVGPGWAIPRDSAQPEAARKVIDFFARPENLEVFLTAEGAYSPYTGGTDIMPELAAAYGAARDENSMMLWPLSTLEWPKPLQTEWEDSLTGFLLNLDKDNEATLQRWDDTVEDNL